MKIPYDQLSAEALQALLEDFASRDGTDYGNYDCTLQQKVDQVRLALQRGEVVICYDSYMQSCSILTLEAYQQFERQAQTADQN